MRKGFLPEDVNVTAGLSLPMIRRLPVRLHRSDESPSCKRKEHHTRCGVPVCIPSMRNWILPVPIVANLVANVNTRVVGDFEANRSSGTNSAPSQSATGVIGPPGHVPDLSTGLAGSFYLLLRFPSRPTHRYHIVSAIMENRSTSPSAHRALHRCGLAPL